MDEERRYIDFLIKKTFHFLQSGGQFDLFLHVTIPNEWKKIAPINIGYTAGIETDRVAPHWVEKSFLMDRIITTSNHSKNVFLDTVCDAVDNQTQQKVKVKCQTPIEAIQYPIRHYTPAEIDIQLDYDFNFLVVLWLLDSRNLDALTKFHNKWFRPLASF